MTGSKKVPVSWVLHNVCSVPSSVSLETSERMGNQSYMLFLNSNLTLEIWQRCWMVLSGLYRRHMPLQYVVSIINMITIFTKEEKSQLIDWVLSSSMVLRC